MNGKRGRLASPRFALKELYRRVAELSGFSQGDAKLAVRATIRAIEDALIAGESVELTNFGTFTWRWWRGRTLKNTNGCARTWPSRYKLRFRPSEVFKAKSRSVQPRSPEKLAPSRGQIERASL